MPKLGLTMEEGTIVEWLVRSGERVEIGAPVLSIETDKVETTVAASSAGWLHPVGDTGSTHPCGSVIGWLTDSPDEVLGEVLDEVLEVIVGGRIRSSPNARRLARELGVDIRSLTGSGPAGRIIGADVRDAPPPRASPATPAAVAVAVASASSNAATATATGAARILADLLGVDVADVAPDPVEQRVTRESVATHVRQRLADIGAQAEPPVLTGAPAPVTLAQTPTVVRRMSGMRSTIAKRMSASLADMAQLTLTMDADVTAVLRHRDGGRERGPGSAAGITDYVIAAVGRALRRHPAMNTAFTEQGIAQLPDVHVGLAVALPDGLVVPVIRHADRLGLDAISAEARRLAEGARRSALGPDDLVGGTFSVSTLGMFGVDSFTPIINPPNVGILGVGRVRADVVLDGDRVATVSRMTLSLTWDHRVLDGAPAAAFCRSIVDYLADPAGLVDASANL